MKKVFLKNKNIERSGFTLVELIVVVVIIATVSALSLFNSSKLNSSVLLSNTAYEVGLIVRDAQISGLGARVLSLDNDGVATTSSQGVYFDINTPERIIYFADKDNDNFYDIGEESQTYQIENKRAGKILKMCKILNNNTCEDISNLAVIFKRPNPEAYFYMTGDATNHTTGLGYQGSVVVNIGFTNTDCKSIIIYKTGAIQIDNSFCN